MLSTRSAIARSPSRPRSARCISNSRSRACAAAWPKALSPTIRRCRNSGSIRISSRTSWRICRHSSPDAEPVESAQAPFRESRRSACDHHFLIEPAEERFLADTNAAVGKPFGDFVAPQIERKRFQFRQQRSPNVAQRMPPPRQIVIDNDDLSTWPYDATKLAERSFAILAGLLVQ